MSSTSSPSGYLLTRRLGSVFVLGTAVGVLAGYLWGSGKTRTELTSTRTTRSGYVFENIELHHGGELTLKPGGDRFLLVPEDRWPASPHSLSAIDLEEDVYLARFFEPGGVGVAAYFDVCFKVEDGRIYSSEYMLAGGVERIRDEVFVRSSSYYYDAFEKVILKIYDPEPSHGVRIKLTNAVGRISSDPDNLR